MTPNDRPLPRCEIELEIPFHDVDMMRVVWHGHYVRYLEIARCALLDMLDFNYLQMCEAGHAWPVIDMRLRYAAPATFTQTIAIEARLTEWEHRLKIDYTIRDAQTRQRLNRAWTVQVAVGIEDQEMRLVSPPVLEQRLLAWQEQQT
ncbi:acyl-CoA thioesterase [Halopseudomonas salegens]|uniref:Acyl-CoA thioester hydrolase n=1 Tax=Halopseudomonas salegens TaxID=1434072 RepID=A0A1H2GWG6_9GAMM|nr:acyl-CoA thioesterase [Halopseudomonas salegens]SDU23943.1 acyl-CoA thioester hydrolase [Halopseudomonas salegens]